MKRKGGYILVVLVGNKVIIGIQVARKAGLKDVEMYEREREGGCTK